MLNALFNGKSTFVGYLMPKIWDTQSESNSRVMVCQSILLIFPLRDAPKVKYFDIVDPSVYRIKKTVYRISYHMLMTSFLFQVKC